MKIVERVGSLVSVEFRVKSQGSVESVESEESVGSVESEESVVSVQSVKFRL